MAVKKFNHYLAAGSDAADENKEDDSPCEHEAAEQLPADSSHVLDTVRDLQHVVPETLRKIHVLAKGVLSVVVNSRQFKCPFIMAVNILTLVGSSTTNGSLLPDNLTFSLLVQMQL